MLFVQPNNASLYSHHHIYEPHIERSSQKLQNTSSILGMSSNSFICLIWLEITWGQASPGHETACLTIVPIWASRGYICYNLWIKTESLQSNQTLIVWSNPLWWYTDKNNEKRKTLMSLAVNCTTLRGDGTHHLGWLYCLTSAWHMGTTEVSSKNLWFLFCSSINERMCTQDTVIFPEMQELNIVECWHLWNKTDISVLFSLLWETQSPASGCR